MKGKTVVITGTSKGIGNGLTKYFLSKGCLVYGCSRSECNIDHINYKHNILDVKDEGSIRMWIRSIKRDSGRIDILICNAGFAPANLLMTMTAASVLEKIVWTNIIGTYTICREVAKVMMKQKSGRIITVSSMAASLHLAGTSAYASSKSAIVEFTKILAKELAPFNITCNILAPSMYITDSVEILDPKVKNNALDVLTIKRPLQLKEIINVVEFFCSEHSACITGQVISMGLVN